MLKLRILAALLFCAMTLPAAAAGEPFHRLKAGDTPALDCGTFIHDRGTEVDPENLRLFMDTNGNLNLRTDQGLRMLRLVHADTKVRESGLIGRGDGIDMRFAGGGKEKLRLQGKVTQAVVDDDGSFPILEFDASLAYTNPQGKKLVQQLAVSDLCL